MPKAWCLRAIVGHSAVIRGLRRPTDASEALSPKNGANSVNWGRWRERWRYGDIPNPSEERKSPTEIYLKLFNNDERLFFQKNRQTDLKFSNLIPFWNPKEPCNKHHDFTPPQRPLGKGNKVFLEAYSSTKARPGAQELFLTFLPVFLNVTFWDVENPLVLLGYCTWM